MKQLSVWFSIAALCGGCGTDGASWFPFGSETTNGNHVSPVSRSPSSRSMILFGDAGPRWKPEEKITLEDLLSKQDAPKKQNHSVSSHLRRVVLPHDMVMVAETVALGSDVILDLQGHDVWIWARKVSIGEIVTTAPDGPPGNIWICAQDVDIARIDTHAQAQTCVSFKDRTPMVMPRLRREGNRVVLPILGQYGWLKFEGSGCQMLGDERYRVTVEEEGGYVAQYRTDATPPCSVDMEVDRDLYSQYQSAYAGKIMGDIWDGGDVTVHTLKGVREGVPVDTSGSQAVSECRGRPVFGVEHPELWLEITVPRLRIHTRPWEVLPQVTMWQWDQLQTTITTHGYAVDTRMEKAMRKLEPRLSDGTIGEKYFRGRDDIARSDQKQAATGRQVWVTHSTPEDWRMACRRLFAPHLSDPSVVVR